jgi:hypothetical protein
LLARVIAVNNKQELYVKKVAKKILFLLSKSTAMSFRVLGLADTAAKAHLILNKV